MPAAANGHRMHATPVELLMSVRSPAAPAIPHNLHAQEHRVMHPLRHLAPVLFLTLMACSHGPEHAVPAAGRPLHGSVHRFGHSAAMKLRLADADLIQRTCALFVSLRSHETPGRIRPGDGGWRCALEHVPGRHHGGVRGGAHRERGQRGHRAADAVSDGNGVNTVLAYYQGRWM